jgi:hypothetical protein
LFRAGRNLKVVIMGGQNQGRAAARAHLHALSCVVKGHTEDARVVDQQVKGQTLSKEGISKRLD